MSQPEGVALGDTEGEAVIVSILWHWLGNRPADSALAPAYRLSRYGFYYYSRAPENSYYLGEADSLSDSNATDSACRAAA